MLTIYMQYRSRIDIKKRTCYSIDSGSNLPAHRRCCQTSFCKCQQDKQVRTREHVWSDVGMVRVKQNRRRINGKDVDHYTFLVRLLHCCVPALLLLVPIIWSSLVRRSWQCGRLNPKRTQLQLLVRFCFFAIGKRARTRWCPCPHVPLLIILKKSIAFLVTKSKPLKSERTVGFTFDVYSLRCNY